MTDYKIKEGYTVPIAGEARKEIENLPLPPFVGISPVEFAGLKPKLAVKVDDEVKIGSPLFFDKKKPEIQFLSPATGRVTAINYGPRRVIEEIIIATSAKKDRVDFGKLAAASIAKTKRDDMIARLTNGGVWPFIRQRPFNRIADPESQPKAIFVNCMDTAPLANDPTFSLKAKADAFKAGVSALKVLCGTVHVSTQSGADNAAFSGAEGVSLHRFSGKHPAGLTGTHIARISPINKGECVWHVHARDVVLIGDLLLSGSYPTERVIAVAGPGATRAQYYLGQLGMKIKDIVGKNVAAGEQRFVSGNVLAGSSRTPDGYLGLYDDLVTILPEGREQHFLGWMNPVGTAPSFTKSYLTGFFSKLFNMNTNVNGGHRAIIQSGIWEQVVALDLHPEFLVKAALAEDVEAMEKLGILECDPEDFALCTYLCPSKTDVSRIIAGALELMEKEA